MVFSLSTRHSWLYLQSRGKINLLCCGGELEGWRQPRPPHYTSEQTHYIRIGSFLFRVAVWRNRFVLQFTGTYIRKKIRVKDYPLKGMQLIPPKLRQETDHWEVNQYSLSCMYVCKYVCVFCGTVWRDQSSVVSPPVHTHTNTTYFPLNLKLLPHNVIIQFSTSEVKPPFFFFFSIQLE